MKKQLCMIFCEKVIPPGTPPITTPKSPSTNTWSSVILSGDQNLRHLRLLAASHHPDGAKPGARNPWVAQRICPSVGGCFPAAVGGFTKLGSFGYKLSFRCGHVFFSSSSSFFSFFFLLRASATCQAHLLQGEKQLRPPLQSRAIQQSLGKGLQDLALGKARRLESATSLSQSS